MGVTFDEKLDFGLHVAEKVNKAYSMLWLIKRNFKDIGAEAFVTLYKHLIRSHLDLEAIACVHSLQYSTVQYSTVQYSTVQ